MIGRILKAWCEETPAVVSLIDDRLWPGMADPTNTTKPFVNYNSVSSDTYRSLAGPSGPYWETVQLDIVGSTYAEAHSVADAIRGNHEQRRLDGFKGSVGGVVVREARWLTSRDEMDAPAHGEGQGTWRIQMDFKIVYDYPS